MHNNWEETRIESSRLEDVRKRKLNERMTDVVSSARAHHIPETTENIFDTNDHYGILLQLYLLSTNERCKTQIIYFRC